MNESFEFLREVPGHHADLISREDGFEAHIECECGWDDGVQGFDAAAIALCAYEDHVTGRMEVPA